ncbi:MAG: hypothetical protein ACI9KE_002746 [Polyangiales bacterium]|jgi:hypothetical protein
MLTRLVLVSLLVSVFACGDDAPPFVPQSDTGPPPDAGPLPDVPNGPDTGAPVTCDEGGPSVTIVEPVPAADASDSNVLIGARHNVRCEVLRPAEPGSFPVDSSSVIITRIDADGNTLEAPVVSSDGDVYQAGFDLTGTTSGPVSFRCIASDMNETCSISDISTLIDLGPSVEITSPTMDSVHATAMNLRYRIVSQPLGDDDLFAGVESHSVVVAGTTITNIVDEGDGNYSAAVDFTDDTIFDPDLSGEFEIAISAENRRMPMPAVRVTRQAFTLDRTPPSITFVSPEEGDLVGGRVRVVTSISDPSGVDSASVVLRVGMMEFNMLQVPMSSDFAVSFDASVFPQTITELTLNVTASDNAANRLTLSLIVKLDSVPPIASLDPPDIREGRIQASRLQCSRFFDPVGSDSVNDGEIVGTAAEFRARTQDEGNRPFGGEGVVVFLAGLRSVQLYINDETDVPLLVDESGDGICDSINPLLEPVPGDPSRAVVVDLEGIRPTGTWPFNEQDVTSPGMPESAYGDVYDDCNPGNSSATLPRLLCEESTRMSRVIASTYDEETIFAKPLVTSLTCVGDAFDFQGSIDEGWSCLAVRSEDNLGNVGVSPPLRACFIDGAGDEPCPGSVGSIAPEAMRPGCTDGCVLPRTYLDDPSYQLFGP